MRLDPASGIETWTVPDEVGPDPREGVVAGGQVAGDPLLLDGLQDRLELRPGGQAELQ
jgi:hypothetical protein